MWKVLYIYDLKVMPFDRDGVHATGRAIVYLTQVRNSNGDWVIATRDEYEYETDDTIEIESIGYENEDGDIVPYEEW